MRVRIHRGTQEIGGNCIELADANGQRIVLDVGRPLTAGWDDEVALPAVEGFVGDDPTLLGILISHPHLDHYGLLAQLPAHIPVFIGREALAVLDAASFFSPISGQFAATDHLVHRKPMSIGPFTVTPFLNDHSAFDAYSLLIEADGARLFYSGDIRAHGRKARCFEELLTDPPPSIDVLLMEGTHVRGDGDHDTARFETEAELEDRVVEVATATSGAVVLFGSAQNLDRVVTAYRAAKRCGREFVTDLYGATVAAATRPTIPQPGFEGLRVYVPQRQRVRVKERREFWRTEAVRSCRVFPEELAANPGRFLLHVPSSALRELIRARVLDHRGVVGWSLWAGYLDTPSGVAICGRLEEHNIDLVHLHTAGHASVPDLQCLAAALSPRRLVPIHSEAGDRFTELFTNVERRADGDWWDV